MLVVRIFYVYFSAPLRSRCVYPHLRFATVGALPRFTVYVLVPRAIGAGALLLFHTCASLRYDYTTHSTCLHRTLALRCVVYGALLLPACLRYFRCVPVYVSVYRVVTRVVTLIPVVAVVHLRSVFVTRCRFRSTFILRWYCYLRLHIRCYVIYVDLRFVANLLMTLLIPFALLMLLIYVVDYC